MAWALVVVGAAAAIKGGMDIWAKNKAAKRAEKAALEAKAEEDIEKAKLKKRMDKYESFEYKNPYANMENTYEDLTVNQQQAQFQAQQGQQQRANIMQNLQGAAGGSGIAALAQSMAGQGQLQTQQISASIGQQEAANQRMAAQGASKIQFAERKGDAMVQSAQAGRVKTLMAMQQGDTAAAMQYSNQQDARQMQADNALTQAWADGVSNTVGAVANAYTGGMSSGGGGGMPAGAGNMSAGQTIYGEQGNPMSPAVGGGQVDYTYDPSDRRLKKNIKKIGKSPSGLNIDSFEFKDSKHGKGKFQGVLSNEVPKNLVTKKDGYDVVDYSKLDVEFKQI